MRSLRYSWLRPGRGRAGDRRVVRRWTSIDVTDLAQDEGQEAVLALACSLHAMQIRLDLGGLVASSEGLALIPAVHRQLLDSCQLLNNAAAIPPQCKALCEYANREPLSTSHLRWSEACVALFMRTGSGTTFVKPDRSPVSEVGGPSELAGQRLAQRRVQVRPAWFHGKCARTRSRGRSQGEDSAGLSMRPEPLQELLRGGEQVATPARGRPPTGGRPLCGSCGR